jgi:hypothetical protein
MQIAMFSWCYSTIVEGQDLIKYYRVCMSYDNTAVSIPEELGLPQTPSGMLQDTTQSITPPMGQSNDIVPGGWQTAKAKKIRTQENWRT